MVIPLTSTVGMITALGRATGTILGLRRPGKEPMVNGGSYTVSIPRCTEDFGCTLLEA